MVKVLTLEDLNKKFRAQIYTQDYSKKTLIDGVKLIDLDVHVGEEGDLSEIIKINSQGEIDAVPGFKIVQINRTKLYPASIKAWHLHLDQDEIWYVIPSNQLFVGLWDLRSRSKTSGQTMRFILGGGKSQLLFIPRAVAHGSANFSKESVELFYFINQKFDETRPDEKRLHWDALGASFWSPSRD